jgi:subtilisin family serine protease/subtilisin-like proprotein convertase family protein
MRALRGLVVIRLIAAAVVVAAITSVSEADEVVQFREPALQSYQLEPVIAAQTAAAAGPAWLKAWPERAARQPVLFGARVVLKLGPGIALNSVLADSQLRWARTLADGLYILQAADAMVAILEAQRLGDRDGVEACYPVRKIKAARLSLYAPKPRDPYYRYQWYFENRDEDGSSRGVDLNIRAAWPYAKGDGVLVAVADDGIEYAHPELGPRDEATLDFNFETWTTNGVPATVDDVHGTSVAGLIAAEGGNGLGMIGTAYRAKLSSWVIFGKDGYLVDEERMADMFEYASNRVQIQNHSWGNASGYQLDPGLVQSAAIENAITLGRDGKGVVMVRAAGNEREDGGNANDDGYASSPSVIAVAAVRSDGRVTSYSNPGACVLVAAPSGDHAEGFPTIFTTDRLGSNGYNQATFTNDFADYAFDAVGFSGTSAATPMISGIAALMLSANPNLTYRDVQQILILASRHIDLADPNMSTNGAGLRVSHNVGYGIPDASQAVLLAAAWSNRPPASQVFLTNTVAQLIPDDGLKVIVTGANVPDALKAIHCLPSLGPHPDDPTASLPLVYMGRATNTLTVDLKGKGALIERGTSTFLEKIQRAADAGAAFVIVFNNRDGDRLERMGSTAFTTIPAVFIGQTDGVALRDYVAAQPDALARIQLESCIYSFAVTNSLQCEHLGVRIMSDHPRRGDLRITLLSPSGTRSVLQHNNLDESAGPIDWTYYSTHHFFETSQGTWTIAISDEEKNQTGLVNQLQLILRGVALVDSDRDGLDDNWELTYFGNLGQNAAGDADGDGFSNMQEYLMRTNPALNERALQLDATVWNINLLRVTWPSVAGKSYEFMSALELGLPWTSLTNVTGTFPETVWFTSCTNAPEKLFQMRTSP